MRIVIADYSGHPFQVELSRSLAARGHAVLHLHFAEFQTPKGGLVRRLDDPAGFAVEAVSLGAPFAKGKFLRRRFQEAKVGRLFAARALAFTPDAVIGCNMPLDAQHGLQRACAGAGVAFIFWLQDIYSRAIRHFLTDRLGMPGDWIGRYYARLEARLLRSSAAVVAISEKFVAPLTEWGVERHRVTVIPNWAPLSEIHPAAKDNEWSRRHGLHDRLVALYTGTLGLKHDPVLLLDLARAAADTDLQVVVISEGPAADWLAQKKRELAVGNLILLPFQPMEIYSQVLGAGDILLAMVGEEAAAFSVPSKILSYLAAGKPVVAAIPSDNDAATTIHMAEAGLVISLGDVAAFEGGILALTKDAEKRAMLGGNARRFAESHFAIDPIAARFEAVLTKISVDAAFRTQ